MKVGVVRYAAFAALVFQVVLTVVLWTGAVRGLAALSARIDKFERAADHEVHHTMAAQLDSIMSVFFDERGDDK